MRLYPTVMIVKLLVVLCFVSVCGGMAVADKSQSSMISMAVPKGTDADGASQASRQELVNVLDLRMYSAATGDLSMCGEDRDCFKHAKGAKSLLCAASVCDGGDKSKTPIACIMGDFEKYSSQLQKQIDPLICQLIKSPSADTRRAILALIPGTTEDKLVENGAYLMALKGTAAACEGYIKNYVGAYGPQWKYQWYRALSGCRILARESTIEMEEKDFYTWFGVGQGLSHCSDIIGEEMRKACDAPQAASPIPLHVP